MMDAPAWALALLARAGREDSTATPARPWRPVLGAGMRCGQAPAMPEARTGELPVVVALGSVDPALVTSVLDGHCRFIADPGAAELAAAAGAIVRADVHVDQPLLRRAPGLRVIARTGVGVDL